MWDRITPGNQYNNQTGQFNNTLQGVLGLGGKLAAGVIGGPLAGAAAGKGLDYLFTRDQGPGGPERSQWGIPQMGVHAPNLGFGGGMTFGSPSFGHMGGMGQFGNNMDQFAGQPQGNGLAGGFMGNGQFNFGPMPQPNVVARPSNNIGKPTFTISGQAARDSIRDLASGAQRADAVSRYKARV